MRFKTRQSGWEAMFLTIALLSHLIFVLTLSVRYYFDIFTKKIQYMKTQINKLEGSCLHYKFNINFIKGSFKNKCPITYLSSIWLVNCLKGSLKDVSESMKIHGQLKNQSEINIKLEYKSMGSYNSVCKVLLYIGLFCDNVRNKGSKLTCCLVCSFWGTVFKIFLTDLPPIFKIR